MIKLKSILSEMRIVSTPKNYLPKLEEIEDKIESKSTPIEEKQRLALEAAKLVLPIWEVYHRDDRPHLAIQAAEEYLNNATKENRKKAIEAAYDADNAADVAYAANNIAAAYAAYSAAYVAYAVDAVDAVDYAIEATKLFFKIEESLNEMRIVGKITPQMIDSLIHDLNIKNIDYYEVLNNYKYYESVQFPNFLKWLESLSFQQLFKLYKELINLKKTN